MASVSQQSQHDLLLLEGATSSVWKFFGFPGKDGKFFEADKKRKRVYCKLCSRSYSYVGNTTNMWQHLEECHLEEYHQAKVVEVREYQIKAKKNSKGKPHSHFLIHHNDGKH